jgi:hypothetical protein
MCLGQPGGSTPPPVRRAAADASRPVLNASFDTCVHHGATTGFAAFHALRGAGSDQPIGAVSCSSARRYERSAAR